MKNATITLFSLMTARLITGIWMGWDRLFDDLFPVAMFWMILFALWKADRCRLATWVHGGYRFIGNPEDIAEVKRVLRHMRTE